MSDRRPTALVVCTCDPAHLEVGGYDVGCPVHEPPPARRRREDLLSRIRALEAKGLDVAIGAELWRVADPALVDQLEGATREQLQEVNELHRGQREGSDA